MNSTVAPEAAAVARTSAPSAVSANPEAEARRLVEQGLAAMRANRLPEAEALFRDAAARAPRDALAHYNLGVVLGRQNRTRDASEAYLTAHKLDRHSGMPLNNLALIYRREGNDTLARSTLERAISAQPGLAIAWFNLGNVQYDTGFTDAALASWGTAVAREPGFLRGWVRLCEVAWQAGRTADVARHAREALRWHPADWAARGWWYAAKCRLAAEAAAPAGRGVGKGAGGGDGDGAIDNFLDWVARGLPGIDVTNMGWGVASGLAMPPPTVQDTMQRWLAPAAPAEQIGLVATLFERDESAGRAALAALEAVVPGKPDVALATNLAVALLGVGQVQHALPWLDRADVGAAGAGRDSKEAAQADQLLGFAAQFAGDFARSRAHFEAAVAGDPDNANAWVNLGLLDLMEGRWAAGWKREEWRSDRSRGAGPGTSRYTADLANGKPKWLGVNDVSGNSALAGRTLLVLREQGQGDTIQHARYLPELLELVGPEGKLRFVTWPGQGALMASMHERIEVIEATSHGQAESVQCDTWCHLMSLPALLDKRAPEAARRYLDAPALALERWARHIAALEGAPAGSTARGTFRVGLCWSGGPIHPTRRHRDMLLRELAPLAGVAHAVRSGGGLGAGANGGVSFYGFVQGAGARQVLDTDDTLWVHDLSPGLTDFAETAAALRQMDLLISVDTAVAHLGGALEVPTWVPMSAVPFFSPLRTIPHKPQSPWYASMRVYQQEPGEPDWSQVVYLMAKDLHALVEARQPGGISAESSPPAGTSSAAKASTAVKSNALAAARAMPVATATASVAPAGTGAAMSGASVADAPDAPTASSTSTPARKPARKASPK